MTMEMTAQLLREKNHQRLRFQSLTFGVPLSTPVVWSMRSVVAREAGYQIVPYIESIFEYPYRQVFESQIRTILLISH
jgi:hypothetical protein